MDLPLLKTFAQIAAPAGLAIGAFLYLARDILAKVMFPALNRRHGYQVVMALAFMAWTVALAGIGSWAYVSTHSPNNRVSSFTPANPPALPADTGWIFAGYFNVAKDTFVEGPYVSVQETTTRGLRSFIEVGDTIALKVSRDVHIVDFRKDGAKKKFFSPITKGVIDEDDKTGVVIPAGTELVVRDMSEGRWSDSPNAALWLRVVYPPR